MYIQRLRRLLPLTGLLLVLAVMTGISLAQDNPDGYPEPSTVTVAGTVQSLLGCPGDWQPECEATMLTFDVESGLWTATFELPAGSYEYKIAFDGSWTISYGLENQSQPGAPNIPLVVEADGLVTFTYDHARGVVGDSINGEQPRDGAGGDVVASTPQEAPLPQIVNIPGTIQPLLDCPGEWQPECEATFLDYDEAGDVFQRTFDVPAGNYEYKVAINGSWAENYGGFADRDGPNIILNVPEDTAITFTYDYRTHWISDNVRHVLATVPGSFNDEIGCAEDWDATCMRTWLQDVDGDGIYIFSTSAIPAGDYEAKVAINLSMDETYGADGAADGDPIAFSVPEDGATVNFVYDSREHVMVVSVGGSAFSAANLRELRARWVLADTIAWPHPAEDGLTYALLYSPDASMQMSVFGLSGNYEAIPLTVDEGGLPPAVLEKFPHLEGQTALKLNADDVALVPEILRGQFAVAVFSAADQLVDIAGVQIPGVLDDLFTYDGALGVHFDDAGVPTISVWAPTAQDVNFLLFEDSRPRTDPTSYDMTFDPATGVWSITGEADWNRKFYLFEVSVFFPQTGQIETNTVTDPYSLSLSTNSLRSQIVNLNDPDLIPDGWLTLEKPPLAAPEDIVIYELHVRDFSAFAEDVPEDLRGTFLAFTIEDSAGMRHLKALADAGLTHIHLLPSFDFATTNENRVRWFEADYEELAQLPPDSDQQQAILEEFRDLDGFNWGYDPYHFNVPEGSYSTNPDGAQRILEFRQMVQALNQAGLRVIMDVVYNHTNAVGLSRKSVFDKIVPGYYYRLDDTGRVFTSTCCPNTASEHNMMERFIVDSVRLWATAYKVDGFRFDLMGHHMLRNMQAVRAMLDTLTLESDGVDGSQIYIYGEGWNFGEVADNARGINATQLNIGGTGIGAFNDRLRDAVRGGNPFGDYQVQGFATGLYYDPNGITPGDTDAQRERLLLFSDHIRIGLAGNLRDYTFVGANGEEVTGADVLYNGAPAGYTLDPQENIVYVSAHDNETFWDIVQYKAPLDTPIDQRVRIQNLGISVVGLSQGVPFYHAGIDMLRSKSFDKNSYNSGDWFNRLDFTYQTNNFGVGLPPAGDNSSQWDIQRPLLANPDLYVGEEEILRSVEHMREILRIRRSSPLFRLQTAEDIQQRVYFLNTGPDQIPGVIVMLISDTVGEDLDTAYDAIVVVFNATDDDITFSSEALSGFNWELHPVQQASYDPIVQTSSAEDGILSVPARTTAVFVAPQG